MWNNKRAHTAKGICSHFGSLNNLQLRWAASMCKRKLNDRWMYVFVCLCVCELRIFKDLRMLRDVRNLRNKHNTYCMGCVIHLICLRCPNWMAFTQNHDIHFLLFSSMLVVITISMRIRFLSLSSFSLWQIKITRADQNS